MSRAEPEKTIEGQAFESALGEYLRRIDAGETVDREAFVAKHSQVADELRSYFATARVLEQMTGAKDDADARPTLTVDTARGVGSDETVPPPRRVQSAGAGSATDLPIPEKFGRYRIVRILGQGAMGVVYLARDTELDRDVALKIPKFSGNDSPDLIERFYREARSAAALQHRNICGIFDIGENDGMRYITMAYIDGRPLSDFVNPAKPLVTRQVATTVRKIALALDIAHQRGIIHRDLKPANILIDRTREPVIMDFGLARQVDKLEDVRITQSGALIGSPAYMSPEQVESDLPAIGRKSDIYSLGVILYELLTGKLPFQGSIAAVIGQIVAVEPKKPSLLRPDIDAELENICLRMMAKKIDDRPASMQDVADLLTNYLKSTARGPDSGIVGGDVLPNPESVRPATSAASATRASQKGARSKTTTRDDSDALFRTARRCVNAHDYEQALKILGEIPETHLTDEMREMQARTQEIQDEVDFLIADIEDCSRRRQFDGVLPKVERLLKLKPGDARARQLYGTLTSARKRAAAPVTVKLGPLGKFRMPAWVATVAALLFGGGLLFGVITFVFRDGEQTIRIEVDAALLAEKNVTVSFDGKDEIKIENIGETIRIKPGKHGYTLRRGDSSVKTRDFTVVRGANPVLHITQEDNNLATARAQQTGIVPTEPKVAVAPPKQVPEPAPAQSVDDSENEPKLNFGEPTGKLVGARERWRLGGDEETFGKVARYVMFSHDSKYLATAWGSKSPKIIDFASGRIVHDTSQEPPAAVNFTPDGISAVLTRRDNGKLTLLDLKSGQRKPTSISVAPDINGGRFTQDGRKLILSNVGDRVAVVDWPEGPVREATLANAAKSYRHVFSPDGKLIALGNGPQAQVSVWDVEQQKKLADFKAHSSPNWLTSLRFSRDGRILATSSHERKVKFWEPETGKLTAEFNHPDWIEEAAFSPDDRYLAVTMHVTGTWIWDVAAHQVAVKLPPHELTGSSVVFSPDGRTIATASSRHNARNKPAPLNPDGFAEVKLWDLQYDSSNPGAPFVEAENEDAASPGQIWTLKGHAASIRDVAISPDSKWIVSCGNDHTVRVWSATTGEQVRLITGDFNSVAFSPDGKSFVLGQGRGNKAKALILLSVGDWKEIRRFRGAGGATHDIAFSRDGKYIATGHPASVRTWDVATGSEVRLFERPPAAIKKLSFTPDGKFLFAANGKNKVICWDVETGKVVRTLDRPSSDSAVLAPNGRWVLSGDWGGGVSLLDFDTGKLVRKMGSYSQGGSSRGVAVSPDSRLGLSGGTDGYVRLFDLNTGNQTAIFGRHNDQVHYVAFSPDGQFAVSACGDVFENGKWRPGRSQAVRVWRLPGQGQAPARSAQPVAAADAKWIKLFNGDNLDGWSHRAGAAKWFANSGRILASDGQRGWLATERDFADFELELEYRLQPGGNSGVFFRTPDTGDESGGSFLEVQLVDDAAAKNANVAAARKNGAIYSLIGVSDTVAAPANAWNSLSLTVVGPQVTVRINGHEVLNDTLEGKKTNGQATADTARASGHIGLQSHGSPVEFRNIRIREMASAKADARTIIDPASNLIGDTTRKYMDILEASIKPRGNSYELEVLAAAPFPSPAEMAGGKRFDFIWFIDIDKNRRTGGSDQGNDYNIHLFLGESGWQTAWYKVSSLSENDGITIHPDEIKIHVEGRRASLVFPKSYLPGKSFEMWASCFSGNAPNWLPRTENPPTQRQVLNTDVETDSVPAPASTGNSAQALKAGAVPNERAVRFIEQIGGKYEDDPNTLGKPIVTLQLAGTKTDDTVLQQLKSLTTVQNVDLNGCFEVTDAGFAALGDMHDMRRLHLWGCHKLTDAAFETLQKFPKLEWLNIGYTGVDNITGSGLAHLKGAANLQSLTCNVLRKLEDKHLENIKGLANLEELGLDYCISLTDGALDHVSQLPRLKKLGLKQTQITDAGLAKLKGMKQLEALYINDTKVTDAGVAELQKALPQLKIER